MDAHREPPMLIFAIASTPVIQCDRALASVNSRFAIFQRLCPLMPSSWRDDFVKVANEVFRLAHCLAAWAELLRRTYPDADDTPRYWILISSALTSLAAAGARCRWLCDSALSAAHKAG